MRPLSLQWRHNGRDGVPNHQPHDCLLNRLFRCKSKKTSKLRVTGICASLHDNILYMIDDCVLYFLPKLFSSSYRKSIAEAEPKYHGKTFI